MDCFTVFYEQLDILTSKQKSEVGEKETPFGDIFTVDLSNNNTSVEYFDKIDHFSSLLMNFFDRYIADIKTHQVLHQHFKTHRRKNYDDLKLMLMVDIVRAYEGMNHSTRLHSSEGIALFLLLVKLFRPDYIVSYKGLKKIPYDIINLDGLVPYISDCSDQISIPIGESVISTLLHEAHPTADRTYRICLYYLFEAVSEVDGIISVSEREYLMTLLHLDDDDMKNDIEIETSIALK